MSQMLCFFMSGLGAQEGFFGLSVQQPHTPGAFPISDLAFSLWRQSHCLATLPCNVHLHKSAKRCYVTHSYLFIFLVHSKLSLPPLTSQPVKVRQTVRTRSWYKHRRIARGRLTWGKWRSPESQLHMCFKCAVPLFPPQEMRKSGGRTYWYLIFEELSRSSEEKPPLFRNLSGNDIHWSKSPLLITKCVGRAWLQSSTPHKPAATWWHIIPIFFRMGIVGKRIEDVSLILVEWPVWMHNNLILKLDPAT